MTTTMTPEATTTTADPADPADTPDKYIVPALERGLKLLGATSTRTRPASANPHRTKTCSATPSSAPSDRA